MFAFPRVGGPLSLLTEGRDDRSRITARALAVEYIGWAFKRDENVRPCTERDGATGNLITTYLISAGDFKDSTYRQHFYDEPQLRGKLVLLASLGQTLYYINLYRDLADPNFSQRDVEAAKDLATLGLKSLARHRKTTTWETAPDELCAGPKLRNTQALAQMKDALLSTQFGLTEREAEVCAGIMIGQTTVGLSLSMGISPNTVATHRKRAYAKLGIARQNELFALYLRRVRDSAEVIGAPYSPLKSHPLAQSVA